MPAAYTPPAGHVPAAPAIFPYAGFWIRVGASLLDTLILMLPVVMLAWVPLLGIPSIIVGIWLYFALQESSQHQATIGKRAMKIYVTDIQGQRISFGQATGRYFSKILSDILCIGYLMVAFTDKKQGLHDMIASTLVQRR
ncbi:MAG TPA: RDD family protein [Candidatus Angelobacter sp.]|nr:RDD family protein [Candidatus Angelobacter sp.]